MALPTALFAGAYLQDKLAQDGANHSSKAGRVLLSRAAAVYLCCRPCQSAERHCLPCQVLLRIQLGMFTLKVIQFVTAFQPESGSTNGSTCTHSTVLSGKTHSCASCIAKCIWHCLMLDVACRHMHACRLDLVCGMNLGKAGMADKKRRWRGESKFQ